MQGSVISVNVKEGQAVAKGETLAAMKP
ncbi:biotin/lipoyl-binding protein [Cupriavidus sp. LEh21]|nr:MULTISPECIES: biotin/lipoyl-binding protein [unclassified Cupriavidus]MDK2659075.1 biotin/lipoyl-binding protein [Cupriavidus sp. LEh21]